MNPTIRFFFLNLTQSFKNCNFASSKFFLGRLSEKLSLSVLHKNAKDIYPS